jgi:hypothetical protein
LAKYVAYRMRDDIELSTHKHWTKRHVSCFTSSTAIDFLMERGVAADSQEAIIFCKSLLDYGIIANVVDGNAREFVTKSDIFKGLKSLPPFYRWQDEARWSETGRISLIAPPRRPTESENGSSEGSPQHSAPQSNASTRPASTLEWDTASGHAEAITPSKARVGLPPAPAPKMARPSPPPARSKKPTSGLFSPPARQLSDVAEDVTTESRTDPDSPPSSASTTPTPHRRAKPPPPSKTAPRIRGPGAGQADDKETAKLMASAAAAAAGVAVSRRASAQLALGSADAADCGSHDLDSVSDGRVTAATGSTGDLSDSGAPAIGERSESKVIKGQYRFMSRIKGILQRVGKPGREDADEGNEAGEGAASDADAAFAATMPLSSYPSNTVRESDHVEETVDEDGLLEASDIYANEESIPGEPDMEEQSYHEDEEDFSSDYDDEYDDYSDSEDMDSTDEEGASPSQESASPSQEGGGSALEVRMDPIYSSIDETDAPTGTLDEELDKPGPLPRFLDGLSAGSRRSTFKNLRIALTDPKAAQTSSMTAGTPVDSTPSPVTTEAVSPVAVPMARLGKQLNMWSELDAVVQSGILETLEKKEHRRQQAIYEILTTEESFAEALKTLRMKFLMPMHFYFKSMKPTTAKGGGANENFIDLDILANVLKATEDIQEMTKSIIEQLRACQGSDMRIGHVGSMILQFLPKISHIYYVYCRLSISSQDHFDEHRTELECFFEERVGKGAHRQEGLPLNAYVIAPVQRMARYPMLVDKVIEYTEEDSDDLETLREVRLVTFATCRSALPG